MIFGLVAEWLSRRIKFGLSRFTIALGGYKLHLNYKNDPTKMKGVQGCADHNYHESDRISGHCKEQSRKSSGEFVENILVFVFPNI